MNDVNCRQSKCGTKEKTLTVRTPLWPQVPAWQVPIAQTLSTPYMLM